MDDEESNTHKKNYKVSETTVTAKINVIFIKHHPLYIILIISFKDEIRLKLPYNLDINSIEV